MNQEIASGRLTSLDAFRGLTIAGMVLVNNPGSWDHIYPPLRHADWNGWTPTDLVFPFFVFIVGASMAFSLGRRQQQATRIGVYRKIIWRGLAIFAIGVFLANFPDFSLDGFKLTGVLQRIAIVYVIASLIALNSRWKVQVATTLGLLLGYWAAMALIPVPGYGPGVLSVQGNLAAYLDSVLLPGRRYHGSWDAEGILSTVPAVATCLVGYLTGSWIRTGRNRMEIVGWMFVSGWGLILIGLFWDIWFPINKGIWTSSYVTFTAGAALQFLGVCYWLIDIKSHGKWFKPAVVFGMNAIALYSLSEMTTSILFTLQVGSGDSSIDLYTWLYQTLFLPWAEPMNASLAFALTYVLIWYFAMYLLYRYRIFIRV
jgi:predicted acyltransferase